MTLRKLKGLAEQAARQAKSYGNNTEVARTSTIDDLKQAAKLVLSIGEASASLLQRHLHFGYAKSIMVVDELERRGIVGRQNGAQPREVIVINAKEFLSGKKDNAKYKVVFTPEDIVCVKKGLDYVFNENHTGFIAPMNFQRHGMGFFKAKLLIDLLENADLIEWEDIRDGERVISRGHKVIASRERIEESLIKFVTEK
jgi:hypothetical protein